MKPKAHIGEMMKQLIHSTQKPPCLKKRRLRKALPELTQNRFNRLADFARALRDESLPLLETGFDMIPLPQKEHKGPHTKIAMAAIVTCIAIALVAIAQRQSPQVLKAVSQSRVAQSPKPVWQNYTIRPGDTLGRVAQRELGSKKRWRELVALNPKALKNPDRLDVGDVIRLPQKH